MLFPDTHWNILQRLITCGLYRRSRGRVARGVGLDRLDAEIVGSNPA